MSELKLTDEQSAALRATGVSVALDAGAGCGKTFVLTERFVRELQRPGDDEPAERLARIAAITFTDAAASELRARVRQRCRQSRNAAAPHERAAWDRLLMALDTARISTIHSFCGALVREHAITLGIDPAYRVMDAATEATYRAEAVEGALRDALQAAQDGDEPLLLAIASEHDASPLIEVVALLTSAAREEGFAKWLGETPPDRYASVRVVYEAEVLPAALEKLRSSPLVEEALGLLLSARPDDERREHFNDLAVALTQAKAPEAKSTDLKELRPLLETKRTIKGKSSLFYKVGDFADEADKKRLTSVLSDLRKLCDATPLLASEEEIAAEAERAYCVARVALEANRRFRRRKRDEGLMDYDDLIGEARRLLCDPRFADVAQQIAATTDLLLVDEFQDTDPLQTDIVRAIAGDRWRDGALFLVGDYKQSIYGFRGAQPEVFRQLRDTLPEAGQLPLAHNFRSQPALIEFTNTLFAPEFAGHYEPLVETRPQVTPTPAVELLWTAPPPTADDAEPTANDRRRAEAASIASRIRELIDSQELLVAEGPAGPARPCRQGDFAILFRSLNDAALYEDALRRAGLDYYVVGGKAFYSQQEVYDVVNLLAVIDSRACDLELFGVLRSPMFGVSDETLVRLAKAKALWPLRTIDGLPADQAAAIDAARQTLAQLRAIKNHQPVAQVLLQAIELTAYDAALAADFLGERKLANLEKLIEQARQYDATGGDLPGFRRQLERFVTRPPEEAPAATTTEDQDVVRLLTYHKSKGLEFPVVILADLDRASRPRSKRAGYAPDIGPVMQPPSEVKTKPSGMTAQQVFQRRHDTAEIEEGLRLAYVACTRAADRLILSTCPENLSKPKGPVLQLLNKHFDLTTGRHRSLEEDDDSERPGLIKVVSPEQASPPRGGGTASKLDDILADPPEPITPPTSVLPVSVDRRVARYSASRLDGSLRRATEDETAVASPDRAQASEERSRLDPLGFGTLVHAVLERLPKSASPEPLSAAIRQWSDALAPTYLVRSADAAANEAVRLVEPFTRGERWRQMTSAKRLEREAEFLLRWPTEAPIDTATLLQGFIDAAYLGDDDRWRIVDYKTNRIAGDEASLAAAAEPYRFQLGLYALAMEQALGETPSELILCFLEPGAEWRFAWNDAERDRATQSVHQAIAAACEAPAPPNNPIAFV